MIRLLPFTLCLLFFAACTAPVPPRVLIFSKTTGYRHQSIEAGKDALVKICYENGILADTTEDAVYFNERNLKRYAAVVFLNTNGEVLNPAQEADFERYIQAGGGFMGVHAASATEYTWRWFGSLLGGYFKEHPAIQDIALQPQHCEAEAVKHLHCQPWTWKEEPYLFRNLEPDLEILLTTTLSPLSPSHPLTLSQPSNISNPSNPSNPLTSHPLSPSNISNPSNILPLSWEHPFDGGRAFYTALGHIPESYSDPVFQQHLLGGLRYAIGKNEPLHYDRCRTQRLPDQTRFVKTTIASDLSEPMEIAGLPDDKLLLIERHGQIKLFNPETGLLNTVTKLPVYSEMGDGLMGLAIDPNWRENHWIYLYYSSLRDSMNQLSRFRFQGDTLDRASEVVLLTIPTGHKDCFHAAGSLTFDGEGNLFLSTGDNTSPFASDGFNPIDERPGRKAFDAQRSAGNTADLRGKILRIKPLADGSYICPAGNLFTTQAVTIPPYHQRPSVATTNNQQRTTSNEPPTTRNEIYVMGCRNPFRISYDERRKLLFWGDIGPDAGKADTARGPMGHDEINRARAAGNFGWPYFTGNNMAYRDYDFEAKKPGPYFDPEHPVNQSPNNTGLRDLPPAQPAFIWYPYGKNREFPIVGTGGRNAMAGPVFYADQYPENTRFPDYYDGKLIVYDWMRNWLMAVTLDTLGNFNHLEPFADSVKMSRPMDMFFDRKGTLWLIEYGTRWYSSNEDARLSRIDYVRGNRPPKAVLSADKTAAAAPADITFQWDNSTDFDREDLQFKLDFGDGTSTTFSQKYDRNITEPILRNPRKKDNPDHLEKAFTHSKKTHKTPSLTSEQTPKRTNNEQPITNYHLQKYLRPGAYTATLTVTDPSGATSTQKLSLAIGNEKPNVYWDIAGKNRSFYHPGDTLRYQLVVNDKEDGSLAEGHITADAVSSSIDFFEKGFNPTSLGNTRAQTPASDKYAEGKRLIDQSDCKSCHAIDRQVNGPAFQAIAERYRSNKAFAVPSIYRKIIYGGSGNWGQSIMIPHPQIREEEAIKMALWILSLGDPPKPVAALPLQGNYPLMPEKDGKTAEQGAFVLRASYRDRGAFGQAALENSTALVLRPALMQAENCDARSEGVGNYKPYGADTTVLIELKHNSWFVFRQVDLKGVRSLIVQMAYGDKTYPQAGGRLEIRQGTVHGVIVGAASFASKNADKMLFETLKIDLNQADTTGLHDLFFVFRNEQNQGQGVVAVDWVKFDF